MSMIADDDFQTFSSNSLFKGMPPEEVAALYALSKEIILGKGDYLLREGDPSNDFYFVMDGALDVSKCDQENEGHSYVLGTMKKGDTIGEMSLLDREARSASAYAAKPSRLRSLSFAQLQKKGSVELYAQLSMNLTKRLRKVNTAVVGALRRQVEEYQTRSNMGNLFVGAISLLTLFTYTLDPIKRLLKTVPDTTYISIPFILFVILCAYLGSRPFNLPIQFFGFTLKNWKQAVMDGFLLAIPLIGFSLIVKWVFIQYIGVYHGHPMIDPFASITEESKKTLFFWSVNALIYCLFVPLQEIIARGVFQGLLEKILTGKWKVMTSIVVSNLMFSAAHVWISEEIALSAFIGGLYFGWAYSRTHNLIGVIILHCICGVFALDVLGAIAH